MNGRPLIALAMARAGKIPGSQAFRRCASPLTAVTSNEFSVINVECLKRIMADN